MTGGDTGSSHKNPWPAERDATAYHRLSGPQVTWGEQVRDHLQLFRTLYRALKPGGLLVAKCGGGPDLARLLERASAVMPLAKSRGIGCRVACAG
jgi:hypothetical protein